MSEQQRASAQLEEQFRKEILYHMDAGNPDLAIQHARLLLAGFPGARTFRFLSKAVSGGQDSKPGFRNINIALLSSFSIEFVKDALIAFGFANGLRLTIYQPGFGAFRQDILDPASGLYASAPDLVVMAVEGEDWLPEAYGRYTLSETSLYLDRFRQEITGLLTQFRANAKTPMLVHGFAKPVNSLLGIADSGHAYGQGRLIHSLNEQLQEVCGLFADIHVLDYGNLVYRIGAKHWYDGRMRLYARFPLTHLAVGELAREYMRYIRALCGLSRKCLVLDLDNTLWGGVIGEDGLDGIQLGPNYPGNAFVEFQRSIKGLAARGVILGLASKNNPQDVQEVFANHPSMVLSQDDFSASEIHWEPKSESLRRIAGKLNIGLEHIVFADDNPAECEHVRMICPKVTVIQLPPQPEDYVKALLEEGWFDVLALSREDLQRSALYQQRAQAETLRESSASLEEFYLDLDMALMFSRVNEKNLSRAAQLTQKTNQFNATTRRYTEGEIVQRMNDPAWVTACVSVADRFGDNGIVGLLMARLEAKVLSIDTFLLSCRVIGRTVETALLAYLCGKAESLGAQYLVGEIIPTPKNAPVRDLYERHGFNREIDVAQEASLWRLDIKASKVSYPAWFKSIIDN